MDKRLKLTELAGTSVCVDPSDAEKVFIALSDEIQNDVFITLSFEDVEDLTSNFLNTAIGQLYGKFKEETIRNHLQVDQISPADTDNLRRSVARAKEYYRDPQRFRDAMIEELGHAE
ncbi:MAG: STAS-like domain-containing protein [Candidatus Sumerlaeota bacterium]